MLLSIRDLSVTVAHRRRATTIVESVSLDLGAGEIVGLVGESGAGKSTVGNAVIGLLEPPAEIRSGSVKFRGKDLVALSPRERARLRGREISMIFQDPQTALDPVITVGRQLTETIRLKLDIGEGDARARALDLLAQVGIQEPDDRFDDYPHQFSGGMRQRVVIALALCANPSVVVADEPTTALDVTLQSQILELIQQMCRDRGLGVLLVTHNMGVIAEVADRVVVMHNGRIVEQGTKAEVLGRPRGAYTRALIACVPRMESGVVRLFQERRAEASLPPTIGQFHGASVVLECDGLTVEFSRRQGWLNRRRRSFRAVDSVSFRLCRGKTLGIVGESGCGKSTLARALAGLLAPTAGHVLRYPASASQSPCGQFIQMIFQDPYASLNPRMRVDDILGEPLDYYRICSNRAERAQRISMALARVGLAADSAERYPHQFSGGQRQRISIARSLMLNPEVLICDEPTSALDVSVQAQILDLLKEIQSERGLALVFISHDLAVVRQACEDVAVMKAGKIVEMGQIDRVFDEPIHPYTRSLLAAMPATDLLARPESLKEVLPACYEQVH